MKHLLTFYFNLKYRSKLILTCILAGFIPMITLGIFCYAETRNLLLDKELDNLSSSIDIAQNSLEYQIQIYENLISYLAFSETMVNVSSSENLSIIEKFEMLNYEYDVLINTIYTSIRKSPRLLCMWTGQICFMESSFVHLLIWNQRNGMIP